MESTAVNVYITPNAKQLKVTYSLGPWDQTKPNVDHQQNRFPDSPLYYTIHASKFGL